MDEIDDLLIDLPAPDPKDGMPERIRQNFRRRIKNSRRKQIIMSSGMLVLGLLLALPGLLAFNSPLSLPPDGLVMFDNLFAGLQDLQGFFDQSWNGIVTFQGSLASSLSLTSWIGIAILGFGILFSINFLMPHRNS